MAHTRSFPFFLSTLALLVHSVSAAPLQRVVVDHDYVVAIARERASGLFRATERLASNSVREINQEPPWSVSFRPEMALWRDSGLDFQLRFIHPGYWRPRLARLNEFTGTHVQPILFARGFFNYNERDVPFLSRVGLDFAGFRALHPFAGDGEWTEAAVFDGTGSYWLRGRGHMRGASAQGLALDAGGSFTEVPAFTEFWIRKPDPAGSRLTVHALLEGTGVAGAYTFVIVPGVETVVEARATLFFRHSAGNAGFVPVSGVFQLGETTPERRDFRPEVHNVDGLLVAPDAVTRLWRPLQNPARTAVTDYDTPQLAGFGLLQRDRKFRSYEDLKAHYERSPGVWIEPVGTWPPGRVRLVETPATDVRRSNVTACWLPRDPLPAGQPVELAWKQHWTSAPAFGGPPAWVSATHQVTPEDNPGHTKFMIDFDADSIAALPPEAALTADVQVSLGAQIEQSQVFRNMSDGSRRLVLALQAPPGGLGVEVHARLLANGLPASETWTAHWQP